GSHRHAGLLRRRPQLRAEHPVRRRIRRHRRRAARPQPPGRHRLRRAAVVLAGEVQRCAAAAGRRLAGPRLHHPGSHPAGRRHRLRGRGPHGAAAGAAAGRPPAGRRLRPGRSPGMSSALSVGTVTETESEAPRRRLPFWAWPIGLAAVIVLLSVVRLVTGRGDVSASGTLSAALAWAMPLALAGLGGLWSERAGVINIGLEGMMILGTWGAAFGGLHGGPWTGVLGAIVCGAIGGLVHALA